MSDEMIQAKIANVTLRLPVYRDKKTTLALAKEVGEVVASMEANADRIDSQAFALRAAFEFARRLKALEDKDADDEIALIKALDGTASALQRHADEYGDGD